MGTFSQPLTFYELRRMEPVDCLTVSDMTGILADHLRSFLDAPAAYAGVSSTAIAGLMQSLEIFADADLLLQSRRESWVYVTPGPAPVTAEPQIGLADMGMRVTNSMAPAPLHSPDFFRTEAGSLADRGIVLFKRTILVAVSAGTRAGTYRAADAVYTWLADMLDVLALDFGVTRVSLSPVQSPGEAEKPLFAGVASNPAVIQVSAVSFRTNRRGGANPA